MQRGDKLTKIPYDAKTGQPASTTDPATWTTFEAACGAAQNGGGGGGVGFVFSEADPFCGIDLDHVRDAETGAVEPWAKTLVQRLGSYSEVSQSGRGLHVILQGKIPGPRRRNSKIEVYESGRFFAMTGQRLRGCPPSVEPRQEQLNEIYAEEFGHDYPALVARDSMSPANTPLADRELIEKAQAAKNGTTFISLWSGDWQGAGFPSQSEADASLLGLLRFWTGGDKARACGLFGQSGLARAKWVERADYREATWAAVDHGDVYQPPNRTAPAGSGLETGNEAEGAVLALAAEYVPFPVQTLPEPYRTLVVQGADSIGCDPALVALPLLAATAGAIGNSRRIRLKAGWCEPAVLWTVAVACSGNKKSPAFDLGIDGLSRIEEAGFAQHRAALEDHKIAVDAWHRSGSEGPKPAAPTPPRSIVRDATISSLAPVLAENPRGVLLARDELAAWLGGFDRFTGGHGEEVAHWLELHRAGKVTVDRKSKESRLIHVPRAAVSITGTIQPATLERVLARQHFENGLAARLLLAWPPRRLHLWRENGISEAVIAPVRRIFERLANLSMATDDQGQQAPVDLLLPPAAKTRWVEFYNAHASEAHCLNDERLGAAWSKLEGAAARLALTIQLVRSASEGVEAMAVDAASLEAAIELVFWFKSETKRLYGWISASEDTRDGQKLREFIRRKGGTVSAREVAKAGFLQGDSERIAEVLDRLAASGQGCWHEVPPTLRGGRRTRRFALTGETGETGETDWGELDSLPAKPAKPISQRAVSPETPVGVPGEIEVGDEVSPETPVSSDGVVSETEQGTL